ncbi:MAG: excinuclease ABC subunit UvrC [Deferribacterota bacterium]|nr:excinuclease ABC subunit UvrC [Deferribacterota bacterium]
MLKVDINTFPDSPGVYMFIGKNEEILYVGKAKSLKKRIKSYFVNGKNRTIKQARLLECSANIKHIVTTTELEAFLLEANIIKTEKPKYNVVLKDSKSYPYIKITADKYPKIEYTRNTSDKKAVYYGPFVNAGSIKALLVDLRRIFPLRNCSNNKFNKNKVCINYQIKRCSGPCEEKISHKDYLKIVDAIKRFFNGHVDSVIRELKKQLNIYAADLRFEEAAEIRDKLKTLDKLFENQIVINENKSESIDAFIFHEIKGVKGLTKVFVRSGKIIGVETDFFENSIESETCEQIILHFYKSTMQFPKNIVYYPEDININEDLIVNACKELGATKINIKKSNNDIVNFALNNAMQQTKLHINKTMRESNTLERLKKYIQINNTPSKFECIDISHISGSFTVGVSISYKDNRFNKNQYRRYRIKTAENNDTKSIYELITRKAKNIQKKLEEKADVYIIDGGKAQLNAAYKAFKDSGLNNINIIAISKGKKRKKPPPSDVHDEIFVYGRKNSLPLKKDDPLLLFIQSLRDEAHRFAIKYSRSLILRNIDNSPLKNIEGIGPIRAKNILEKFPDIYINKNISKEKLMNECRLPASIAEKLVNFINNN